MIPMRLTLERAAGIKAGLNLDKITIDFAEVPDDAAIVMLKGDNGAGKSTLLNLALHPWRQPPHMQGSLYDNFGEGDGLRELIWVHGATTFKSRIEIKKSGKTQSCRCYLHTATDDGWKPYQTNDNIVSDGKASTYDALIERILGPQSLYFLSAFRAQNAPTLAEYDKPKELMRDLLGLDGLASDAGTAHEVTKALSSAYFTKKEMLASTASLDDEVRYQTSRITEFRSNESKALEHKRSCDDAVTAARATLEKALSQTAENDNIRALRDQITSTLEAAVAEARATQSQLEADASEAKNHHIDGDRKARDKMLKMEDRQNKLLARIESQRQLLKDKDKIEQAMGALDSARSLADAAEKAYRQTQEDASKHQELEHQRSLLFQKRNHLIKDGKRERARFNDTRARSESIDQVPCGGIAPYDKCPLIKDAIAAKEMLPGIEKGLDVFRGKYQEVVAEIEQMGNSPDAPPNPEIAYAEFSTRRSELKMLEHRASSHAAVKGAEDAISTAEADLAIGQEDLERAAIDREQLNASLAKTLGDMRARRSEIEEDIKVKQRATKKQLDALPPLASEEAVNVARHRTETAEKSAREASADLARVTAEIATAESALSEAKRKIDAAAPAREALEKLGNEVSMWKMLEVALKGVIDLTIEDAGPSIAAIANDLLIKAYGPRFSIRIVTQKTLKNGETRETFDISVIDSETEQESSLLSKSGGEKVWINKALCDAVAIHHQRVVGIEYGCAFGDEVEDGLTQERKRQFYMMERHALEIAGYQRKFLVSHDPQAWEQADWIIDLGEMRAQ